VITVYKYEHGSTEMLPDASVDPAWLQPGRAVWVWVDLNGPTQDETKILSDVFHFHELAIEDAVAEIQHPKVESYGSYLYLVLHGIDFHAKEHCFKTRDADFFLGQQYLVTVHSGESRSIKRVASLCTRNERILGEGPAGLMHRIIDAMVDNYRPEVDKLNDRLDRLEKEVFERPRANLAKRILDFKKDISSLRRIVQPQRDVVGRLARREFPFIDEALSYRYRDVHDHLVRMSDEALFFQDRVTSLLDAHLSTVSNQLNGVMKVLTIIATLFMPLTVLTGMWGMNVSLPHFIGGEGVQFWWVLGLMIAMSLAMLAYFRNRGWI
jgi:magnesium transporter